MVEPFRLVDNARSFLIAARRTLEQRQNPNGTIEMLVVPAVVCYAFASEMALKALGTAVGENISRSHDLKDLFDLLPDELQIEIGTLYSNKVKNYTIVELLDACRKSFAEWRYFYEKEELKAANINALDVFATTLVSLSQKYKGLR